MTQDEVKTLFTYEDDGRMRRIGGRKPYVGRGIGRDKRYLAWDYKRRTYYLHQLIYLYHFGFIPALIDHIDRNPRNNAIENLRACTNAENQYNALRKVNNKSGFKGVVQHKNCTLKKWQAKITVNKKVISLGYYATPEEASEVYAAAAGVYAGGFAHPNPNRKKNNG